MTENSKKMRINVGCGDVLLKGYKNCDLFNKEADVRCDVGFLPFKDNSCDEILAQHIIEHFSYPHAIKILEEWKRVLKPGGVLIIETPDFYESCKKFVSTKEKDRHTMYGHFFAKPWVDGEIHKFLYTKGELWNILNNSNFVDICFTEPTRYLENPNLRVECKKNI